MTTIKLATITVLVAALLACGVTRQAREVKQSGFLGDYSILTPGPEGGAKLVYQNPAANIKSYDKIWLVPVTIWAGEGSDMNGLSPEDRKMVADRLFAVLQERLVKDYALVQQAGPNTMRIAVALTAADHSYPVMDTISTIVPIGLGVSTLKAIATGKPAFVGEASVELRVTDSQSGTILFEAVDSRVGTKNPMAVWDKWEDVDTAFAYWADRMGYKLCTERGATDCVAP
jgi:hypothetical protein